jgi:hypothetical protein
MQKGGERLAVVCGGVVLILWVVGLIGFILVGDGQTDTATQNKALVAFMLCPFAFGIPYGAVKGVFWVIARFQKG